MSFTDIRSSLVDPEDISKLLMEQPSVFNPGEEMVVRDDYNGEEHKNRVAPHV